MQELETERLWLRQFRREDLDRMAEIFGDPVVMRFIASGTKTRSQLEAEFPMILQRYNCSEFGMWAVVEKASQTLLGRCGLIYLDGTPEIELGYALDKAYWNRGIATEASIACLRFGFEQVGLERVVAISQPENLASQRVMQKVGMTFEKNAHYYKTDVVYYAISKNEFHGLHG
ncbi:GNAT family N-acetyltransferase [Cyanobacteria bacterium FACHB-DQ100]|uniref:GNAT family N-acetyltransferase n=1 Tax=Leptolyngbya sp. DQ-M1 TaxID=2933920 RepID=UPI0019A00FBE|nr:GNAT family N-acetyltransferase [Cyanobacteria bacterium FACHB-DQ100]